MSRRPNIWLLLAAVLEWQRRRRERRRHTTLSQPKRPPRRQAQDIPRGTLIRVDGRIYDAGDYLGNIGFSRLSGDDPWEPTPQHSPFPFPEVEIVDTVDRRIIELLPPRRETP